MSDQILRRAAENWDRSANAAFRRYYTFCASPLSWKYNKHTVAIVKSSTRHSPSSGTCLQYVLLP